MEFMWGTPWCTVQTQHREEFGRKPNLHLSSAWSKRPMRKGPKAPKLNHQGSRPYGPALATLACAALRGSLGNCCLWKCHPAGPLHCTLPCICVGNRVHSTCIGSTINKILPWKKYEFKRRFYEKLHSLFYTYFLNTPPPNGSHLKIELLFYFKLWLSWYRLYFGI